MTSNMPLESSPHSLGHTLFSTFQTDDITIMNSARLYPYALVEGAKHLVLGGYAGLENAVRYIIHAAPEQGVVALDESVVPQDRTFSAPCVTSPQREAEGMLEQGPHNHSNSQSFLTEANDLEEAGQPTTHEDHDSEAGIISRSKHIWVWMTVLVVGVLSLVVVPGLVVGIITGQIPWGIALAGAIATVVSFFAGLYYHHNK